MNLVPYYDGKLLFEVPAFLAGVVGVQGFDPYYQLVLFLSPQADDKLSGLFSCATWLK